MIGFSRAAGGGVQGVGQQQQQPRHGTVVDSRGGWRQALLRDEGRVREELHGSKRQTPFMSHATSRLDLCVVGQQAETGTVAAVDGPVDGPVAPFVKGGFACPAD